MSVVLSYFSLLEIQNKMQHGGMETIASGRKRRKFDLKFNPAVVTCAEQMELEMTCLELKEVIQLPLKMCVLLILMERKSLESFFICLWILSYEEQLVTFSLKPKSHQKEKA